MAWDKNCKDCQYGRCSICRGDGTVKGMFGNCTSCHVAVHGSNLSPQLLK